MSIIKDLFTSDSPVEYLPVDYCKDKSDQELAETLKRNISFGSGQMIVRELLERLVKRK